MYRINRAYNEQQQEQQRQEQQRQQQEQQQDSSGFNQTLMHPTMKMALITNRHR